jgi:methyltransferase (TIGR00027 family)
MMRDGPSRTALRVAQLRAAHQLMERGAIFSDPFAIPILGENQDDLIREAQARPERWRLRLFVAVRSRFAEDSLAAAYARGTRQTVVLGAGLDTFGLRNPYADLRVFEADHPATQDWKRMRLLEANLSVPRSLRFVALDFERQSMLDELVRAGFDRNSPAFFMWLGAVPYLTREAVFAALTAIASVPMSEAVFDYGEPVDSVPPERRAVYASLMRRTAAAGEPLLSFFRPEDLHTELTRIGYSEIEDLGPHDIASRYFRAEIAPHTPGGHILRARL